MVRSIIRPTARHGTPNRTKTIKFSAKLFVPQHAYNEGDTSKTSKSLDDLYSIDFENDMIEEGSKSIIYKCIHKETNEERCVKIVEKSSYNDDLNESIGKEIDLLKRMDHPNIVRVFSTFEDEKFYYIVMDYCKGGELRDQIIRGTGMSEFYVAVLVKTILSSINYCYQKHNVVHLGIKPENILLEGHRKTEQLKLIDFGNSIIAKKNVMKMDRLIGGAAYLSPESLQHHNYSHKTDIWAIGVLAFFGLSGNLPFDGDNDMETLELILQSKEEVLNKDLFRSDPDAWGAISEDAIDFVSKMLSFEPFKRPTAKDALKHPWIQRVTDAQAEVLQKRDKVMAQNALEEIFRFRAPSKLQQAALSFIASQCLSMFDKDPIERIYQAMDIKHTGKLTMEDFKTGYTKYMEDDEKELTSGELRDLFSNVDLMGNKTIDYSEFLIASLPAEILLTDDNIHKVFNDFDRDGDGKISKNDLKQVMTDILKMEPEGLEDYIERKILKGVVEKTDSMINYETFSNLLQETKAGPGRDPLRRSSTGMSSAEFKVERMSIYDGNAFDQFRSIFERNLTLSRNEGSI